MLKSLACFLLLTLACTAPLIAQSLAGLAAINGTVRDPSGAIVAGATVTVSNSSTGLQRDLITNESGYFFAPSLPPGPHYTVSISARGFDLHELKGLRLQVGQTITLPIVLRIAGLTHTVEVSDLSPIVDQIKVGVAQVVDNDQIQNLPINGRRVDTFVLLTPGVTNDGQDGRISFRGVPGAAMPSCRTATTLPSSSIMKTPAGHASVPTSAKMPCRSFRFRHPGIRQSSGARWAA